jgi:hypothetical protein
MSVNCFYGRLATVLVSVPGAEGPRFLCARCCDEAFRRLGARAAIEVEPPYRLSRYCEGVGDLETQDETATHDTRASHKEETR